MLSPKNCGYLLNNDNKQYKKTCVNVYLPTTKIGLCLVIHSVPFVSIEMFCLEVGRGKGLKRLLTVWHIMLWLIWRARNDFNFFWKSPNSWRKFWKHQKNFMEVVDWRRKKKKGGTSIYYEWTINPIDCIFRYDLCWGFYMLASFW
jgi:hypothetical protein